MRKFILLALILYIQQLSPAFSGYVPLVVNTGFNADVIANGTGSVTALTNNAVDNGTFVLVEIGWKLNASSNPLAYGLPANRIINNTNQPGLSYQIASYDANNTLRLPTNNTPQQVSFQPPYRIASKLYLLATGGSGACVVSVKINFTDNTSQTQSNIAINDWFNGTPFIIGGIGRVGTPSNLPENPSNGPRLYQYEVNIATANQTKQISSVEITKTSGTGIANIFAFAIKEPSTYTPWVVSSGFNTDVIADSIGTTLSRTTNDVDADNKVFIATGWQYNTTFTPHSFGLPANGIINSLIDNGLSYQLAPYNANNCLRLGTNNAGGTLTFQTPRAAENIYLLHTTGNGSSTMNITVNFSDNTSQTFNNIASNDWFFNTPFEIGQTGRIDRNTTSTNSNIENQTGGPRMYRSILALNPANYNKPVTNIQITRVTGSGTLTTLCIFGASGEITIPYQCSAPTAPVATAITATTATLSWVSPPAAINWQIGYGPQGFNINSGGTRMIVNTNPYLLNPPLTPSTTYDYYVRAICGPGDTSAWSVVHTFTTRCLAPDITRVQDSFVCESGRATLEAYVSGGVVNWYSSATGGPLLHTGNIFITPNISATTVYYAEPEGANACKGDRVPVTATVRNKPVVSLGNDTTLCPGATITLTASSNTSNNTYLWSTQATTASIAVNTTGQYAVTVTSQGCSQSDTVEITGGTVPVGVLPDSASLCVNDTVILNAGNAGSTYLWSTNANTRTITVSTPGTYTVSITSSDKCTIQDQCFVALRNLPAPPFAQPVVAKCPKDTIFLDALNSGHAYLWNTGATSRTIGVRDSGTYEVTITSPYGCSITEDIKVIYEGLPQSQGLSYVPYFYNQMGEVQFSVISPSNYSSVQWDFGDGTQSNQLNPRHRYSTLGVYTVTVTLFNDCGSTIYSQNIKIDFSTHIDEIAATGIIRIYPNPAHSQLYVQATDKHTVINDLTVLDIQGRKIPVDFTDRGTHYEVNTGHLPCGLYILALSTDQGEWKGKFEVVH